MHFILTRSMLELLHISFCTFVPELCPLIYAKISFPLHISVNEKKWTEFHNFFICIHIYKIYVVIVTHHFLAQFTRVMVLDLRQNFISVQYLVTNEQILTKLYITIYTDKIYIGIVSRYFSQICKRVMALD